VVLCPIFIRPVRAKAIVDRKAFALTGRMYQLPCTQGDALGYGLLAFQAVSTLVSKFAKLKSYNYPLVLQSF
jgi:hypothetical protein